MASRDTSTLLLFDVDGTLTPFRKRISDDMDAFMQRLKERVVVGLVGGSDLCKIAEQMGVSEEELVKKFDYVFSENGLVAHKNGELIGKESILSYLGEEKTQQIINFALRTMSELTLPCKRGTFVEFRTGLINICPVGRSCSQEERDQFGEYDKENKIREQLVAKFQKQFPEDKLRFVIGGQISIDVFPEGWDKRFCLKYLEKDGFKAIHFFGDRTFPGGNDYEIYSDPRTIGHSVQSPEETQKAVSELVFQ